MAGDVNAWWTAIDDLPQIVERLKRVQIVHQHACDVIPKFDQPDGLIYCDPPYVHAIRSKGGTEVYGAEMSDDDHQRIAYILYECKSKVVLSGYPSDLYNELYASWRTVDFFIANHASGASKKAREVERLWFNF